MSMTIMKYSPHITESAIDIENEEIENYGQVSRDE